MKFIIDNRIVLSRAPEGPLATIINYVPFIRSFLKDRFGGGPVTLPHLCARDVVR